MNSLAEDTREALSIFASLAKQILRQFQRLFILMLMLVFSYASPVLSADVQLYSGFNFFSYPTEPPVALGCSDLQALLGADELTMLDGTTQLITNCGPTTNPFNIVPGAGYIVRTNNPGIFTLNGDTACPLVNLSRGINLIGIPTPPTGIGCFDLLASIGDHSAVSAIQFFNPQSGRYESCAYDALIPASEPLGSNFPILPGAAYWVSSLQAQSDLQLNDITLCQPIIDPPIVSGVTPVSGPIGTLVTLSGNHFNPAPGLAPEVLMHKQGGGTLSVPIASYDNNEIRITIPTSANSGPFTIKVGEQTVQSSIQFSVQTSSSFQLIGEPSATTVIHGHSAKYSLELSSNNNFNQLAELKINGLPSNITATFAPQFIAAGQRSELTLTADSNQSLGMQNFSVTASAVVDGLALNQTVPLVVTVIPETTSFMGQAVISNTEQTPLAGVTVTFLGVDSSGNPTLCSGQTVSDAAGNFSFIDLPPECTGEQLIRYDGLTVTNQPGVYAGVDLLYNIADGIVTESPVLIHLPRIDDKETVMVRQNWHEDQFFTFDSIPNLDVTVYAGTILTLRDGGQPDPFPLIAINVPVDRLPDEMPPGTTLEPFIVAFQPANATASQEIAVAFPNLLNTPPGTNVELSTLDPTQGIMVIYGTGTVSADGTQIIPDFNPANPGKRYGLVHFDWHGPAVQIALLIGNVLDPNKNCPRSGGPIDISSGIEIFTSNDISIDGPRGAISIERTYRTFTNSAGPFGIGTSHNYHYQLNTNSPQSSNVINLISPEGNQYPFVRGSAGVLTNASAPFLRGVVMSNASAGKMDLRWKDGTVFRFFPSGFFLGSLLESITDRNGNTITLIRDSANPARITEITDPVGRALTLKYDSEDRIVSVADPAGRIVQYTYNLQGTLSTVTDPDGGTIHYQYDLQNQLIQVTDRRGVIVIQNLYNSGGRVIEQTRADGGKLQFLYTLMNSQVPASPVLKSRVTDALGNESVYRLNAQGYVVDVVDALGQLTLFEREPGSNLLLSITDPLGRKFKSAYDSVGNRITLTDAAGNVSVLTYEPEFNNVTSITDPLGNITTFEYDANGNLILTTDPLGNVSTRSYNQFGQIISEQDPLGNTSTATYDDMGNLIELSDPLGNRIVLTYDSISRQSSLQDELGNRVSFAYDFQNRIVALVDAQGKVTSLDYDANGNLVTLTDANGNSTSYNYDVRNRLNKVTDLLGQDESYSYDLNGNLTEFTDRKGQATQFVYDALNRRMASNYADGNTTLRSYDIVDRLIEINDSQSGGIKRNYDLLDQLSSEVTPAGAVDYTYDELSRRTSMLVNHDVPVTYSYNFDSRLEQVAQAGEVVDLEYDSAGRRTRLGYSNGVSTSYSYDAASRLIRISHQNPSVIIEDLTYTYDAVGNQTRFNRTAPQAELAQPMTASYNAANQLTLFNNESLAYDENGNLSSWSDSTTTTAYSWDARNRLIAINGPGVSAEFSYDPLGRRTSKTVNGSKSDFLYDGNDIVAEMIGASTAATYLRGLNIDEPFVRQTTSSEYYHADSKGSVVATTDVAGTVVTSYSYSAFGQTTVAGTSDSPFQYTGRENDANTGLYYSRARYYSPVLRRFISEDPIRLDGGGDNYYSYVLNNPVNRLDPDGLKSLSSRSHQIRMNARRGFKKANKLKNKFDQLQGLVDSGELAGMGLAKILTDDPVGGLRDLSEAIPIPSIPGALIEVGFGAHDALEKNLRKATTRSDRESIRFGVGF